MKEKEIECIVEVHEWTDEENLAVKISKKKHTIVCFFLTLLNDYEEVRSLMSSSSQTQIMHFSIAFIPLVNNSSCIIREDNLYCSRERFLLLFGKK